MSLGQQGIISYKRINVMRRTKMTNLSDKDCKFVENSETKISKVIKDTEDIGCGYARRDKRNEMINNYLRRHKNDIDSWTDVKHAIVNKLKSILVELN
jgi:hypothetical protein